MIDGILIRMNGYEGKKHFQNELLINRKHPLVARISLTMAYFKDSNLCALAKKYN